MKRSGVHPLVKSLGHGKLASCRSLTGNGPASPRARRSASILPVRSVTLALQGGGALGRLHLGRARPPAGRAALAHRSGKRRQRRAP